MISNLFRILSASLLVSASLSAQDTTCYSLSLNSVPQSGTSTLPSFTICLHYYDAHGILDTLGLTFINAEGRRVGSYSLNKTLGDNQAQIDLATVGVSRADEPYLVHFTDERGQAHNVPFQVHFSETLPPTVNIQSEAIRLDCESADNTLVHYLGNIQGGRPPYLTRWQVLDQGGQPLYTPRSDTLATAGLTPRIQVESTPTYTVALRVEDACGETTQQVVQVQCDGTLQKSSTLFVKAIRPNQTTAP